MLTSRCPTEISNPVQRLLHCPPYPALVLIVCMGRSEHCMDEAYSRRRSCTKQNIHRKKMMNELMYMMFCWQHTSFTKAMPRDLWHIFGFPAFFWVSENKFHISKTSLINSTLPIQTIFLLHIPFFSCIQTVWQIEIWNQDFLGDGASF